MKTDLFSEIPYGPHHAADCIIREYVQAVYGAEMLHRRCVRLLWIVFGIAAVGFAFACGMQIARAWK